MVINVTVWKYIENRRESLGRKMVKEFFFFIKKLFLEWLFYGRCL